MTKEFDPKSVHTSCHDCAFRLDSANSDESRRTQVGCYANRLDVFTSAGTTLIEAKTEKELSSDTLAVDEFYVIPDRVCRMKKVVLADEPWPDELKREMLYTEQRRTIDLKVGLIVLLDHEIVKPDFYKRLENLVYLISQLEYYPTSVRFIGKFHSQNARLNAFLTKTLSERFAKVPFTWRCIDVLEDTSPYEKLTRSFRGRHVDIALKRMLEDKPMIDTYHVCDLSSSLDPAYFATLNRKVRDELWRFLCIESKNYPCDSTVFLPIAIRPDIQGNAVIEHKKYKKEIYWKIPDKMRVIFEGDTALLEMLIPRRRFHLDNQKDFVDTFSSLKALPE